MGNINRTSSDRSTDDVSHRLPEDLRDPEQRDLDEILPEADDKGNEDASNQTSSASSTNRSKRTRGAGSAGAAPPGVGSSPTEKEMADQDEVEDSLLSTLLGGVLSADEDELSTDGAGIPPSKLRQWSKSGPSTSPKRTKDALSKALRNSSRLDQDGVEYRIFLQGSYKNHTNIHGDSDVDIVIQVTNPYRRDSSGLLRDTESVYANGQRADYGFREFKRDVVAALREEYGASAVQVDDKAVKVRAGDSALQIDADIVVCQKYKPENGREAMWFRSESGQEISNYPQMHYQRGADKNQATDGNYRKTVRMFKRARQNLVHKGRISKEDAPSYFVACLLSNVPNQAFVDDPQERYVRVVNYLYEHRDDLTSFTAQHGQHEMFGRDSTRWNQRDARRFINELVWLYENYYR